MRRHHVVPLFYLRGFADDARQVRLVDRDDVSRSHSESVRTALSEAGFYRLDPAAFVVKNESQRPQPEVIEEHLSQFEAAAAPGVYQLRKTGLTDLTQDDWFHLTLLIALQTVRGNRFREDLEALGTQALRTYLGQTVTDDKIRRWLRKLRKPSTMAAVRDFREELTGPQAPRLVPAKEFAIRQGVELALGSLCERLAGMAWSLVETDETSVLTSDEPVCWWSPGDEPIGCMSAQVMWFPVSRRQILQLRDRSVTTASLGLPDPGSEAGRDALVRLVNREVASQAHRWVVHHPEDQPLDGLVLKSRTAWADELMSVEERGTTRRELYRHRRLPGPVATPRRSESG